MEKKKDVIFVKAVAILLVVLGHSIVTVAGLSAHYSSMIQSSLMRHLFETIYVFHMPLFFTTSGYVLALSIDKDSFAFDQIWIVKKVKRLVVPLLVIAVLYSLPIRMLTGYYGKATFCSALFDLVYSNDVGYLWYMETLFVLTLLFARLKDAMRNNTVITTLFLFVGYIGWYIGIGTYDKIFLLRYAIWLWLGMLVYRNVERLRTHKKIILFSSALLALFGLLGRVVSHNAIIDFAFGIMLTVGTILGLYALAWNVERLGEIEVVKYLNKNAMPIYLFHEPMMCVVFYTTRNIALNPYFLGGGGRFYLDSSHLLFLERYYANSN